MVGRKILVISDDPKLLGTLQRNLPGEGYQVTSVEDNVEEPEAMLGEVTPDLIILDIQMPRMDGIELCLRIRQWFQIPIIMLSTWEAKKDTVRSLDLSADGYLTEPFGIEDLMTQIENTFSRN